MVFRPLYLWRTCGGGMSDRSRTMVVFTLLAAFGYTYADAAPAKAPSAFVTVVVCNSVGIAPEVLAAARETAARVYKMIGVDILWRDRVDQAPEAFAVSPIAPVGTVTLYVRLVPPAWQPRGL